MKQLITLVIVLTNIASIAQTKGNKKIVTKTYAIQNVENFVLDMYAEVVIDCGTKESLTITIDENLLDLVDKKVKNSTVHLSQLKWIEPSKRVKIKIIARKLKRLEVDTHETVRLSNVNRDSLELTATIGKIKVAGNVKHLSIIAKHGAVDATNLIAKNADVHITGRGKVALNVTDRLSSEIDEDGVLVLENEPKFKTIKQNNLTEKQRFLPKENLQWINLKIKNNSWNRNKFVVIGPKKDGGHFSYGFAMFPGTVKKERWSIGTKVYRDKGIGVKEYLVTVREDNKNGVLKLFKD
ncbi:GIN domain-containing protein [Flagellimonas sp. 2504JD1-5]